MVVPALKPEWRSFTCSRPTRTATRRVGDRRRLQVGRERGETGDRKLRAAGDQKVIGKDPSRTIVPVFKVAAVVVEPFGAHPGYSPGFYDVDFTYGYHYQQASNTVEGFQAFLDEWVYGVKDRSEYIQHYIQKFGFGQYNKLRAKFDYSYPVSYAY
jgi:hypothetical protein